MFCTKFVDIINLLVIIAEDFLLPLSVLLFCAINKKLKERHSDVLEICGLK